MRLAISHSRKYVVWAIKIVFLLVLLLSGGKAQIFWENGQRQLFGYQNIFFYALLGAALCAAVWKFEDLCQSFRKSEKKHGIWYAVYFSVSFALFYNPLNKTQNQVKEFKRVIGTGVISGTDVSRRIHNFNVWFFFFVAAFVLFFLLANDFMQKDRIRESRKVAEFADHFIVLANVHLVFRCILYFNDMEQGTSVLSYSANLVMLILMAVAAYFLLHLEKSILAGEYAQLLTAGFSASYPAAILLGVGWHSGKLLVGMQTLACIFCIFLAKAGKKLFQDRRGKSFIACSAVLFSLIPFATSFYIELINILNQYGIFVADLRKYYGLLMLLAGVLLAVLSVLAYQKRWDMRWWKRLAYPALVFGITCLSVQIPLENSYDAHMFETANHGVLISDFLNFGSIPLVEHFGGHMMTNVWEGIIYGILNQDAAGAVFSPYAGYLRAVLAVLFFYLVKHVWDENAALFAALLFPFSEYWNYYGLGMLVCLAVAAYVRKNTYQRAAVVWLAFIWCALYRLDIGAAFGIACVASLAIYVIIYRKWNIVRPLAVTLAGWLLGGAALWFGICMAKGIHPIRRLREFLALSLSNPNWAFADIGDSGQTVFAWVYVFLPFAAEVCLIFTVFSKKLREQAGAERWALLLLLGTAYLGNFSRGLVRHSLEEGPGGTYYVIEWTAFVFLAMFVSCLRNNRKLFLPVFMGLILCNNMFIQGDNFKAETIADKASVKTGNFTDAWAAPVPAEEGPEDGEPKTYWRQIQEKGEAVKRVRWEKDLEETVLPYQTVLDALLEKDETFVDFTNQTFLYAALGRKNPVYVSQSPLQLSGEYAQEQFVEEMEGVPLVLMPMEDGFVLDWIVNECRYYKVAEYIYQNYVPLCKYKDSFAIWCLPERHDEMENKAGESLEPSYEMIRYGYDGPDVEKDGSGATAVSYKSLMHNYAVTYLPEIWAESDQQMAVENPVAAELTDEGGCYAFRREGFWPGADGNYLLIEASCDGTDPGVKDEVTSAVAKLGIYENGKFVEKYQYAFALREGRHKYLFRVSSDYYWYCEEINAVSLQAEGNIHDIRMRILEGD